MLKWEYKTIQVPFSKGWGTPQLDRDTFDTTLNHLGREGWEMVSALLPIKRTGDLARQLPFSNALYLDSLSPLQKAKIINSTLKCDKWA